MSLLVVGTLAVVALAVLVYFVRVGGLTYWRARGARVVTCPETHAPAGVSVDAGGAALAALRGHQKLALETCTRWPERAGCGQECLEEIAKAPDGCLVRTMLGAWYEGKSCVLCGKDLSHIDWATHKPGLVDAERRMVGWDEIAAVDVPRALETHRPVCWDCQIIESLVRQHPERVVLRPPH